MPENNTHSTEDAAEFQERRNYVAHQGIKLKQMQRERQRDKSVMESRHKPTTWKHEDGYTQI